MEVFARFVNHPADGTRRVPATLLAVLLAASTALADDVDRDLAAIAQSGPNGAGAAAARDAAKRLAAQGPEVLPRLLAAMDTPNVIAANWCRTVFDGIVDRELAKKPPGLPREEFRAFVVDGRRQGRARRLVLELLDRLEPDYRPKVVPTLLDDPEFREEAVASVLKQGDEAKQRGDLDAARAAWKKAFRSARASDQLTQLASRLQGAGEKVSVVEQMGFLVDWYFLGPFDAPEKTGFAKSFPPEQTVDLKGEYPGKTGEPIRWKRHHTADPLGQTDLMQAIAPVKEAVGYAFTELHSDVERKVQLRCGADDNLSVWINGEKAFAREQWLNGTRLDRFVAPATLKAGVNRVLVKICQGPQHTDPEVPNNWSFQVRLCEPDGLGVPLKCLLPGP